jgi:hypothetical protein
MLDSKESVRNTIANPSMVIPFSVITLFIVYPVLLQHEWENARHHSLFQTLTTPH